ncbi:MAG: hypothetical protein K6F69_07420 [Treponema sp.]|nr:hypothetical protein [Treponema sp.]
MTNKNTKAKKLIQKVGMIYGVSYDDKTYKNIKKILECYREFVFNQDYFNFTIAGKDSIAEVAPIVYRSFIGKGIISDDIVNKLVIQILNDEKTADIVYDTLENIKNFMADDRNNASVGEIYYGILKELYFAKAYPTNTDVYLKLGLESSVYSYRKEEATMLFGIYFWSNCLSLWNGMAEEKEKIQAEEGRQDLMVDKEMVI